ncbi:retropepsin-like aspartic protease family protein [Novosphingobium malaysiense]|uniref:Aspartyl protease n=1 Tax=Novosphingobium malaysiense TaxID=1348853 RepID=A0A0B1ZGU9_9SPHN|nr:TIGR02281 family clan AA aspartic protease [Novosphingobium malaysiense]KHK89710.1 aspartyl protease [Novosphingobium malaysiense]
MRAGPVILLFATVALVGWIAPGLSGRGQHQSAGKPEALPTAADPTSREAWLSGGTVLERAQDGHFYADADVDARSTHFLVDTGASVVALTGSDAQAIGLVWNESDLVPVGRGASGTVYGVPVRLQRVELEDFAAHDVPAAIIPEGLDVSLLGQSFLAELKGVRIEGDRMILGGEP